MEALIIWKFAYSNCKNKNIQIKEEEESFIDEETIDYKIFECLHTITIPP